MSHELCAIIYDWPRTVGPRLYDLEAPNNKNSGDTGRTIDKRKIPRQFRICSMVQKVFRCKLSGKEVLLTTGCSLQKANNRLLSIARSLNIFQYILGWRIWCRRSSFKCRCPKTKSCASEDNDNKETSSKIYSSFKSSSNCKTHDCSYQWCWWLSTNCTI